MTHTVRPNARVRIVRTHPTYQEFTLQPIRHDGTHYGPETKMPFRTASVLFKHFAAGQEVDLWTSDGLPIDRRAYGRSQGEIHALSFPQISIGRTAAMAIAANIRPITSVLAMSDDELAADAEAFMRSRVGEVSGEGADKVMKGQICMSLNTRRLLYTIRTVDAGEITLSLSSEGELGTIFFYQDEGSEVQWRNKVLSITGVSVSESAVDGLVGQEVSTVFDHPLIVGKINGGVVVPSPNQQKGGILTMEIDPDPVGSFVPGSQWMAE